jgi:putative DNA methylase
LKNSETVAGALLSKMPEKAEPVRQLAYRLYTLCERKGWAEDARNYNELITSWYAIVQAGNEVGHSREQMTLTFEQS